MGNLKKELHFPYPHIKKHDLFWRDYINSHFFVDQGGAIFRGLLKISHGFLCVEREGVILFFKFPTVLTKALTEFFLKVNIPLRHLVNPLIS